LNSSTILTCFAPNKGNGARLCEEHLLGSDFNHGGGHETTLEVLLHNS